MPKHVFSLVFGVEIRSTGGIYIDHSGGAHVKGDKTSVGMENFIGDVKLVVDNGAGAEAGFIVLGKDLIVVCNVRAQFKCVLQNVGFL